MILSGPSGVGKSTIHGVFKKRNPDFRLSVSVTTRSPREGEKEGVNYYYRTEEEFDRLVKEGAFVEHVSFSGHRYGTLHSELRRITEEGHSVVLDVEAVGAINVKKINPSAILIFILPPSYEELRARLVGRGSENEKEVLARLATFKSQVELSAQYDYVVVNKDIDTCAADVQRILEAERQGLKVNELLVQNNLDLIRSIIQEVE